GLIVLWKNSTPVLRSQKEPKDWNSNMWVDLMGISGVSLEAASGDDWAVRLSSSEATLAAGYATLELNGFPRWMTTLARVKPKEVCSTLIGEIRCELFRGDLNRLDTLDRVANADAEITAVVAAEILSDLENREHWPVRALLQALRIVVQGADQELA